MRYTTIRNVLIGILVCLLFAFAPVLVPKANRFAWFQTVDTAITSGSIRIDSSVKFTKYASSDTNKVLGISSFGLLVLRTKTGADSSVFATKAFVGNNYVPLIRTITTGWNSIAYILSSNAVLIAPGFDKVLAIDSFTNRSIRFKNGTDSTHIKGDGYQCWNNGTGDTTLIQKDNITITLATQKAIHVSNAVSFYSSGSILATYASDKIRHYNGGFFGEYSPTTLTGNRVYTFQNASGTVAFTSNSQLRTQVITGTGIATSFTFASPVSGTLISGNSASLGMVVADISIVGTTVTLHTVSAPAIGSFNLTYMVQ